MNLDRFHQRIEDFQKAVRRLDEACQQKKNDFIRDSLIQRFEFCYELAWKMLRLKLLQDDIDIRSPKATLQAALEQGLIEDGNPWTKLQRVRNLTTHTYDASLAEEVYSFVCRSDNLFCSNWPLRRQRGNADRIRSVRSHPGRSAPGVSPFS